ncbi:hypothetical protein GCM10009637_01430 [Brevibacterium luteolum]
MHSAAAAMTRTSMTRLNSKGVPSKKIAGGKNSCIVGGWNPPSPAARITEFAAVKIDTFRLLSQFRARAGKNQADQSLRHTSVERHCHIMETGELAPGP